MKVKDLKIDNLVGIKVRIPKKYEDSYVGIKGDLYLFSYWNAGLWLKKKMSDSQILPLCIDPRELLNFTVVKG